MQIGIRLHDTGPGSLAQRAQEARAQGFHRVHLALSKVLGEAYGHPAALTSELAEEVVGALAPLNVAVLGCYLNLAHPDEDVYAGLVERYRAHLRFSRWLGGCVVGTETGNPNAEYRFDPETSHTDAALEGFIRRLAPVVREAERTGAVLAIEPVYTHIVSTPARARRVLDVIASPQLKIILDPVNLLHPLNLPQAGEMLAEAIELLGPDTAVFHIKDYVRKGDELQAVAAGSGEMDYAQVFRYIAKQGAQKPVTLENTTPANAVGARRFVEEGIARYTVMNP
jgi:sugar phosphate isomerase/epimerase